MCSLPFREKKACKLTNVHDRCELRRPPSPGSRPFVQGGPDSISEGPPGLGRPDQRYVAALTLHLPPRPNRYGLDGISWFDDAISTAMKTAPEQLSIDVSYYVTDTTIDDDASVQSEKSKLRCGGVSRNTGRPRLHAVVKEFCAEKGTVAIASAFSCHFLYRRGVAEAFMSHSLWP